MKRIQLVEAELSGKPTSESTIEATDTSFQQSIDELELTGVDRSSVTAIAPHEANKNDVYWRQLVADAPIVSRRMVPGARKPAPLQPPTELLQPVSWLRIITVLLLVLVAIGIIYAPTSLKRTDWHLRCGAAAIVAGILVSAIAGGTFFLCAIALVVAATLAMWLKANTSADPILSAVVVRARNQEAPYPTEVGS